MYTSRTLSETVRERLEALEVELDRPIRCLDSRRRITTYLWDGTFAFDGDVWGEDGNAYTTEYQLAVDNATERGITIIMGVAEYGAADYTAIELPDGGTIFDVIVTAPEPDSPIRFNDKIIGAISERCVYDYVGLPRLNYDDHGPLVDAVIEGVRMAVDPDFLAAVAEQRMARQREQLVEYGRVTYSSQLVNERRMIDELARQMTNYEQNIANSRRSIIERQLRLDAILAMQDNDAGETMVREWDLLKEHPRIESLDFAEGEITITTTPDLVMTHPAIDETRWLGAFRITLNPSNSEILLRNLSTRRNGRDHPHVTDGTPCFGGGQGATYQLLAEGQLYVLFEVLLQYLETVNPADEWGRYASYWFDEPDARPANAEVMEAVPA